MNPSIGEAIKTGFQTATQSLRAVPYLFVGLVLIFGLSAGVFLAAGVPLKAVARVSQQRETIQKQIQDEAKAAQKQGTQPAPRELTPEEKEITAWTKKVWPLFPVLVLFWIYAFLFLQGGQIGYLVQTIRGQSPGLSEFLASGRKFVFPLLGTHAIAFALFLSAFGVPTVIIVLAANVLPKSIAAILALILVLGFVPFAVWLGLKLFFYPVSVVSDERKVIESLKFNFQITKGRVLSVLGFAAVLWLLEIGFNLGRSILNVIPKVAGPAAGFFAVAIGIAVLVGRIYLEFWKTASIIHYYDRIKSN